MSNQLLNELHEVFPPVEIALPTRGIFYAKGVLADNVDPSHITVGTLGILDEFKYRDPFMLVSGKAITHLIHHLCGDQVLLPEEMCEVDVETILIASRLASYGPNLKIIHHCPLFIKKLEEQEEDKEPKETSVLCNHENTLNIDLHEFILRYGPIQDENRFEIRLPRVGQTVYLRPTPYRTMVKVMKNVVGNRRKLDELNEHQEEFIMNTEMFTQYEDLMNLSTDLQIQTLLDCIWGVRTRSGHLVEDTEEIAAWIFELPKSDHDVIAKRISEISEDFRKISLIPYICAGCGGQNEFSLQMNSEILFLAASEGFETPTISSAMPEKNKNTLRKPSRISRKSPSTSVGP